MKFAITKNTHVDDGRVFVTLELRKEDLAQLISNGVLAVDVPDTETGEIQMTVQISIAELAPRRVKL